MHPRSYYTGGRDNPSNWTAGRGAADGQAEEEPEEDVESLRGADGRGQEIAYAPVPPPRRPRRDERAPGNDRFDRGGDRGFDRGERNDRFDRGERNDRGDRGFDRGGDRFDRNDRYDRNDRGGDRSQRGDRGSSWEPRQQRDSGWGRDGGGDRAPANPYGEVPRTAGVR